MTPTFNHRRALALVALLALLLCQPFVTAAHDTGGDSAGDPEDYRRTLIIVKATADYRDALRAAREAARKLQLKLDLRERTENKQLGLTHPLDYCMHVWNKFPCYEPRMQTMEDGEYVTLEYSTGYNAHATRIGTADPKFPVGLYLVVVASGDRDAMTALLPRVKTQYPKAYILLAPFSGECTH
jgi:hypothetical protein